MRSFALRALSSIEYLVLGTGTAAFTRPAGSVPDMSRYSVPGTKYCGPKGRS
jgi:hypothetical protein